MGYVYFVEETPESDVKIGFTESLDQRLMELQIGNSHILTYRYVIPNVDISFEKAVHEICKLFWKQGEWFDRDVLTFLLKETSPWFREHMVPIRNGKLQRIAVST